MENEGITYQLQEVLNEGDVTVGVANTMEEQIGRLQVLTQKYQERNYLDDIHSLTLQIDAPSIIGKNGLQTLQELLSPDQYDLFRKDGLMLTFSDNKTLYIDKYHWSSIPFVAKTLGNRFVGSARLIIDEDNGLGLPTLHDDRISIDHEWQTQAQNCKVEFSQFATIMATKPSIALLRAAYKYSKDVLGTTEWLATTDNMVVRLLNGTYFHFNIPKIGPSVNYLGSESTPVYINCERSIENAGNNPQSSAIAQFLDGCEDVGGFEWYQGP